MITCCMYVAGMRAGDNTLNALTALQTALTLNKIPLQATPATAQQAVMENYVRFLTTPGRYKLDN